MRNNRLFKSLTILGVSLILLTGCKSETVLEVNGKKAIEDKTVGFSQSRIYHNVYKNDKKKIFSIYEEYDKGANDWAEVENSLKYDRSVFEFFFDEKDNLAGIYIHFNSGNGFVKADINFIEKYKLKDVMNVGLEGLSVNTNFDEIYLSKDVGKYTIYFDMYDNKLHPRVIKPKNGKQNENLDEKILSLENNFNKEMDRREEEKIKKEFLDNQEYKRKKKEEEANNKREEEEYRQNNIESIKTEILVDNPVEGDGKINLTLKADFSKVDKKIVDSATIKYLVEIPLLWKFEEDIKITNNGNIVEYEREVSIDKEKDTIIVTNNQLEISSKVLKINE